MHFNEERPPTEAPARPLNLGLNDGTWAAKSAVEALQSFSGRNSLRNYTTSDNSPLIEAIASVDGVSPEHIYLANGSGPLLKQCVPHLVKSNIMASPWRMLRHVFGRNGYPIITPAMTYCKVPKGAERKNLTVRSVPLSPEDGFTLRVDDLRAELRRQDGVVYIVNPNNPTGNVLIDRESVVALATEFPRATFWIDEAYVQYIDPAEHRPLSDLVPQHKNLVVSRSFSFAYGLAGLRLGYLLCAPDLAREFENQVTDYRVGALHEAMGAASVTDPDHLHFVRRETAAGRALLVNGLADHPGLQSFPSVTNFVLFRFTDGRSGEELARRVAERGVLIKRFDPTMGFTYEPYFRLTVGLKDENQHLLAVLKQVLDEYPATRG